MSFSSAYFGQEEHRETNDSKETEIDIREPEPAQPEAKNPDGLKKLESIKLIEDLLSNNSSIKLMHKTYPLGFLLSCGVGSLSLHDTTPRYFR